MSRHPISISETGKASASAKDVLSHPNAQKALRDVGEVRRLTEAQCNQSRSMRGSFNDMVQAIYDAGRHTLDVEKLIVDCVPGGDICDPQKVADAIREWFGEAMKGEA